MRFFRRVMYLRLLLGYMSCAFFAGSCISDCFWDSRVALFSPGHVSQTAFGVHELRFFRPVMYLRLLLGYMSRALFAKSCNLRLLLGYMSCAFFAGSCISDCFWDTCIGLFSPGHVSQTGYGVHESRYFRSVMYLRLLLGYMCRAFLARSCISDWLWGTCVGLFSPSHVSQTAFGIHESGSFSPVMYLRLLLGYMTPRLHKFYVLQWPHAHSFRAGHRPLPLLAYRIPHSPPASQFFILKSFQTKGPLVQTP